jgi:protein-S-isoprenylcysteine O-methyltransferase Ste14
MKGPYRWVRHPFYDAAGLFLLFLSIAAANWFLLVCGSAVLALLVIRTSIEESNLRARFGESYRSYERRTGRFIPRFAAAHDDVRTTSGSTGERR